MTRAGVRSKDSFSGDRFSVESRVAGVGPQMPAPGDRASPLGFAALTILFDGSGRNRVGWILTSEGTLEAWSVVDGRSERLDDRKLGTKMKVPVPAVVRRGDTFRAMLYGFGSSENNWYVVRVVTLK